MKLSVLIPMYNANLYIANCLESLINQDLSKKDYEIIIMDDGSKDNCKDIVKDYLEKHEHISLYVERNVGSDSTRNKLLKLAKGDYVYFLDADDYLVYNSLGGILEYASKNDLDLIGFDTLETSNLKAFKLKKGDAVNNQTLTMRGLDYIKENKHLRHEVWWYFVKRKLLINNNISFDESGNNADVIFTLKALLKSSRMAYKSIQIHRYVQTTTSVMRDKSVEKKRKLIDSMYLMILSYSRLINTIENEGIKDREIIISNLKYRRDVFTFFNIINMIREKYRKKDVSERLSEFIDVKAYPINYFTLEEYNTLKFRFLNRLVNNKPVLLNLIALRNKF
ncbi:hypothetical protein A8C32_03875 [Flavivirga aquatica]|uniref:Glycosyltransferase 2-like domain-containing protein n=1 Tax=Flavivirga aquatica TaxID=1849968 RepID=A0A1E5TB72_9FLAO|nr:glycosyltransferase [Flavivirga aquatica]OEK08598.1 hypothetical protein A8C32_03875 [Flavivirga aquatica]